ncbi:unnamed protein product [Caenorhabditis auriculariae]|uniref:CCHC-type domain-containing protein n=1 Tax=Caenorhabditis auriculariae TaxID=2777116 RepID=A0A8S1HUL8_9PELO|nr:unnamed protein product [Caenorhabditis auriculariae]
MFEIVKNKLKEKSENLQEHQKERSNSDGEENFEEELDYIEEDDIEEQEELTERGEDGIKGAVEINVDCRNGWAEMPIEQEEYREFKAKYGGPNECLSEKDKITILYQKLRGELRRTLESLPEYIKDEGLEEVLQELQWHVGENKTSSTVDKMEAIFNLRQRNFSSVEETCQAVEKLIRQDQGDRKRCDEERAGALCMVMGDKWPTTEVTMIRSAMDGARPGEAYNEARRCAIHLEKTKEAQRRSTATWSATGNRRQEERATRSFSERERLRNEGACYRCGQQGHVIARCPRRSGYNTEDRSRRGDDRQTRDDRRNNYRSEGGAFNRTFGGFSGNQRNEQRRYNNFSNGQRFRDSSRAPPRGGRNPMGEPGVTRGVRLAQVVDTTGPVARRTTASPTEEVRCTSVNDARKFFSERGEVPGREMKTRSEENLMEFEQMWSGEQVGEILTHLEEVRGAALPRDVEGLKDVYWITMAKDVKSWTKECQGCFLANPHLRLTPPLKPIITSYPLQLVGVDIAEVGYNPRENGITERVIGTILRALKKRQGDPEAWDVALPLVVQAYNATPHEATGESPFFLMHGFDKGLPLELTQERPGVWLAENLEDYRTQVTEVDLLDFVKTSYGCERGAVSIDMDREPLWSFCQGGHTLADYVANAGDEGIRPVNNPRQLANCMTILANKAIDVRERWRSMEHMNDEITTIPILCESFARFAYGCERWKTVLKNLEMCENKLKGRQLWMVLKEAKRMGEPAARWRIPPKEPKRGTILYPVRYGSPKLFHHTWYELRNISSLEEIVRKVEAMRRDPVKPDLIVLLIDDSMTDLIAYGNKLLEKAAEWRQEGVTLVLAAGFPVEGRYRNVFRFGQELQREWTRETAWFPDNEEAQAVRQFGCGLAGGVRTQLQGGRVEVRQVTLLFEMLDRNLNEKELPRCDLKARQGERDTAEGGRKHAMTHYATRWRILGGLNWLAAAGSIVFFWLSQKSGMI